ncbi:MAG: histidine ammonia-lyase [Promethearchaeia archaeon]
MLVIQVDGESLILADVVRVARDGEKVSLTEDTKQRVLRSRDVVEKAVKEGKTIYGVNTGFGDLARVAIDENDLENLQVNLLRSHSAGVGSPFPTDVVRAMMLLRANALAKGFSGVSVKVVETLLSMLNKGVVPVVPQKGSVGASGDLTPLAHMALVLIGEGTAEYEGERMEGSRALERAGIKPLTLGAKEGVALINGTQPMTAVGVLTIHDALNLVKEAIIAGSMSLEALRGTRTAFDERIHKIRPHNGQIAIARALMKVLRDSEINQSHADCGKVQDAYSLRCAPQVLGASLDAIGYVKQVLDTEINSATDNPLIFPENNDVLSGGNFHGQPVALAMDFLSTALSEIANISERRIYRLTDSKVSGLAPFLTEKSGLQSGMMILQYTAASLVSENKTLAHPASVDSIPTSAGQEDHVSMGLISARHAREILDNTKTVVAIEYLCAAQGLDLLAPLKPSIPLKAAHRAIRESVTRLRDDRSLSSDIEQIRDLMDSGQIVSAVENETGLLLKV